MEYRPGVCNIGDAEARKRRRMGHAGIVIVVLFTAVRFFSAHLLVEVGLVAGLVMAFEGLLQARLRFCAGFAQQGVYDVSEEGEDRQEVIAPGDRRKDALTALKVHMVALIGTVVLFMVLRSLPTIVISML